MFANVIIICNTTIVISILEDVSGPRAFVRANDLIKGQTQVGLLIFLGSTIGLTFVVGLFEHRLKILSYGDGASRVWEGPLLVVMYSFVVFVDTMMNAVFYFSCISYSMEAVELGPLWKLCLKICLFSKNVFFLVKMLKYYYQTFSFLTEFTEITKNRFAKFKLNKRTY